MRIASVATFTRRIPLTRPYAISYATTDVAELAFVRVVAEDGTVGLGSAAPVPEITGETFDACVAALDRADEIVGLDAQDLRAVGERLDESFRSTPAARAALDIAVHDLDARLAGESLCARLLARPGAWVLEPAQMPRPTSITIGVQSIDSALAEADEYAGRGFRAIKVKVGSHLDRDVELLRRLRERVGPSIALRADANAGYRPSDVERFFREIAAADLELVEQPCPREADDELRRLPEHARERLVADESLHGVADAHRLLELPRPYGVWNVKLMKCGGIGPAREIATLAQSFVHVMWGCMDESVIGIAAALHAAQTSWSTRYLDLDGSFDLAADPARGGFELAGGMLSTLSAPGLGVELVE